MTLDSHIQMDEPCSTPRSFFTKPLDLPDLHYVIRQVSSWILIDYGGESITGVDKMARIWGG